MNVGRKISDTRFSNKCDLYNYRPRPGRPPGSAAFRWPPGRSPRKSRALQKNEVILLKRLSRAQNRTPRDSMARGGAAPSAA